MTLRSKRSSPEERERLVVAANARACGLLDQAKDKVLVVYEDQSACIYYEREDTLPRASKVP